MFSLQGCRDAPTASFRLNLTHERPHLDPRQSSDIGSYMIHSLLFEGLVEIGPNDTLYYRAAKTIEVDESGTHYLIILNPTYWSDGSLITANDFIQSWLKVIDPSFSAPNAHLLFPIQNAKAIKMGDASSETFGAIALDDKTLSITLESPCPYFLNLLAFPTFYPIHPSVESFYNDKISENQIVCNGLYTLQEWIKGHKMDLVANPKNSAYPKIKKKTISLSFVKDEATVFQLFKTGQIDIIGEHLSTIPKDYIYEAKESHYYHECAGASMTFCAFNLKDPLLSNLLIRKALSLSIDYEGIISFCNHKVLPPTGALVPALLYKTPLPYSPIYNPELAKELFQKALDPAKNPQVTLTLMHSNIGLFPTIAQILAWQWKQNLGIEVHLQICDHYNLLGSLVKHDYQMALTGWIPQYADALAFLERFEDISCTKNYVGFDSKEYTALLQQARQTLSLKEREKIYQHAEQLITDQVPFTPIYQWKNHYLYQSHIQGFQTLSLGSPFLRSVLVDES